MKGLLIFCLIILTGTAQAAFDTQQLTISLGMVNASYSENKSALESSSTSSTKEPASGSASVLPIDFLWEIYQNNKRSFFARATIPLLTSGKDSYFSLSGGMNFYFKSLSSTGDFKDENDEIYIIPKVRYYWGGEVGAGYLVYTTKTAKKSDLLADLGLHIGIIYKVNDDWSLRAETGYARALGVATTTSLIRASLGFTRDINNFF